MPDTCDKSFVLAVGEGSAPCSLFIGDGAVFGVVTPNNGCPAAPVDGFQCEITGLPIGSYRWEYVSDAYFVGPVPCYWVNRPVGCSGLAVQLGHQYNDGVTQTPPGGNYIGFPDDGLGCHPTEAAAEAAYLPLNPAGTFFVREPGGVARLKTCSHTGSDVPLFHLVRATQLIADQPLTLQIGGLASYAAGRFTVAYSGDTTASLAFTDAAAAVEAALNVLPSIVADGGVACAGTLAGGMTITWNVNGNRPLATALLTTVSPGIAANIVTTQEGTGALPEIQTLTVVKFCADFVDNALLPEWDGATLVRNLSFPRWRVTDTPDPNAPTLRFQNLEFQNMQVRLNVGPDAPTTAPTVAAGAAGNVDAGSHQWKIAFVTLVGFGAPGPASSALVLGVASQVNLSNIPVGPAGTTARQVYRTLAGGSTFYLVDTIANNVDTTYLDDTDDASVFNSGFGIPAKPQSCFWQCTITGVFQVVGIDIEGSLWSGVKLVGNDPTGTYALAYPWDDTLQQCPVVRDDVLQSLALSGTF